MTAAYCKVSTPIRPQTQKPRFVYGFSSFTKKGVSGIKQEKRTPPLNSAYQNESRYQISAETKNFDFWTKFAQKRCFRSKTEKLNSTIEFCIFELVWEPNFNLNWQLRYFGQNLSKNSISGQTRKNRSCVCVHSRYLLY